MNQLNARGDCHHGYAQEAYARAVNGRSEDNNVAVKNGFKQRGIDAEPRVNAFTRSAWKAVGRFVKAGEQGVTIPILDPRTKQDLEVEVFHVSQTAVSHNTV